MYQIQNRSVWEHELYSFDIKRDDLKWLERANIDFLLEKMKLNEIDQIADATTLKGKVYRRRVLNPKRLKGVGALFASYSIYSYLPYLAVYAGATMPVIAACAAGLYGMLAFSE